MPKIKATKIEDIKDAQYGDLIFFTPTSSLFSRLIPVIDGSPYSHVGMYLGRKYGHNLFIESQDGVGVVINRLQEWRNYTIIRVDTPIMPISKVLEELGKPYDRKKIIAFLFNRLFGIPLIADDNHAHVCSELVNYFTYYKLAEKGNSTMRTILDNIDF
jgi:hypothetical protein